MSARKTTETFKKEVLERVGDEYTLLSKYGTNNMEKVKIRHNVCSYTYWVSPNRFLCGRRCPRCKGGVKKTHLEFLLKVRKLSNGEYQVLSTYTNNKTKVKFCHLKCGYIYYKEPRGFINGDRCPKCSGLIKRDTDSFKKKVFELVSDRYEVLGDYKNNHSKILFKHIKCNNSFFMCPKDFTKKNGNRCPFCKKKI
jgi:hypothetical protein